MWMAAFRMAVKEKIPLTYPVCVVTYVFALLCRLSGCFRGFVELTRAVSPIVANEYR